MTAKVWKWLLYIVPIVAFAVLLNSGEVLKRPMGKGDDLTGSLHRVESAILAEDWARAGGAWAEAHLALGTVSRRIELTAERDQIQHFYEELARLRGAIQSHEKGPALEHVSVMKALFQEFGH